MKSNKEKEKRKDHWFQQGVLKLSCPSDESKLWVHCDHGLSIRKHVRNICFERGGDYIPEYLNEDAIKIFRKRFEDDAPQCFRSEIDELSIFAIWPNLAQADALREWKKIVSLSWANMYLLAPAQRLLTGRLFNWFGNSILHIDPSSDLAAIPGFVEAWASRTVNTDYYRRVVAVEGTNLFAAAMFESGWTVLHNRTDVDFVLSDNPTYTVTDSHKQLYYVYVVTNRLAILRKDRLNWNGHALGVNINLLTPGATNFQNVLLQQVYQINYWTYQNKHRVLLTRTGRVGACASLATIGQLSNIHRHKSTCDCMVDVIPPP